MCLAGLSFWHKGLQTLGYCYKANLYLNMMLFFMNMFFPIKIMLPSLLSLPQNVIPHKFPCPSIDSPSSPLIYGETPCTNSIPNSTAPTDFTAPIRGAHSYLQSYYCNSFTVHFASSFFLIIVYPLNINHFWFCKRETSGWERQETSLVYIFVILIFF